MGARKGGRLWLEGSGVGRPSGEVVSIAFAAGLALGQENICVGACEWQGSTGPRDQGHGSLVADAPGGGSLGPGRMGVARAWPGSARGSPGGREAAQAPVTAAQCCPAPGHLAKTVVTLWV